MVEKKQVKTVMLIPGAETEEGRALIAQRAEERNQVDFRAFRMLQELREDGVFNLETLTKIYREDWTVGDDWTPEGHAREVLDEIEQIMRDRSMADHNMLAALAGRPV